jgi:Matrixin
LKIDLFRFCRGAVAVLGVIIVAGTVRAASTTDFRLLTLDGAAVRWPSEPGTAAVVTYAVAKNSERYPQARNCKGVEAPDDLLRASRIERSSFDQEVRAAFDMWERVTDIEFREVDDPNSAGIVIGAQTSPEGHAFANVDYKLGDGQFGQIYKSLICLNPTKKWKVGYGGSLAVYDLRYTIAHEIGHAIGLDHPDSSGQLMSFTYNERVRDLQEGDVAGAIRIYGLRKLPVTEPETATTAVPSRPRG